MNKIFDKIFKTREESTSEKPPIKTEDEIEKENEAENMDQQIEAAAEKLEDEFESLQEEIKSFGGEEKLTRAMKRAGRENIGVVKSIIDRAGKIALGLGLGVAFFGNIRPAIASGDYGHVAAVLITWTTISIASSSFIELVKRTSN